ncbi:MAG: DinB family protein [Ferruginibacter sp.]|nr:DinB family protein [Ferruginibacter sp.]
MKETERIAGLFEDIYNADPWIDVTLLATLENISAEIASKKITPRWNSVWEILIHIIKWRENVLQRVQGIVIDSPADNYFTVVSDQSEKAWQHTLQDLKNSQQKWIAFLEKMEEEDFDKIYPANGGSYYKHIHGIIQHDAYHLGQIVMLVKNMDS